MSVSKTIIQLINQETVISIPITETTDLYKDLYLDSLSFIGLIMDIEELYNIKVELSEMTDCHIFGLLTSLVERKIKEAEKND